MNLLTIRDLVVPGIFIPHSSFLFLCVDLVQIIERYKIIPSKIGTVEPDSTSYKRLLSFSEGSFNLGLKIALLITLIISDVS